MLSRKQFDILAVLERNREGLTQRDIASKIQMSAASVNSAIAELNTSGLTHDGIITDKGIEALEPYRVKRAVFIAAGFGSRLVPITLNTPKPLVRVKGKMMIETLLDAVTAAGITDIVIVRGYLKEQFDQLLYKYPTIRFIDNPYFNEANNISSAMMVRDILSNAYVLEADLLLSNKDLITKYQYRSNYLGVPVDKTDDWCFATKNGKITKVSIGGENCHQMIGISYWNEEDGKKLCSDIKSVYEMPGGKERYWDQVPLEYYIRDFEIDVRECTFSDIIEIDTFNELKAIDSVYDI